jgi:hypothetical protein
VSRKLCLRNLAARNLVDNAATTSFQVLGTSSIAYVDCEFLGTSYIYRSPNSSIYLSDPCQHLRSAFLSSFVLASNPRALSSSSTPPLTGGEHWPATKASVRNIFFTVWSRPDQCPIKKELEMGHLRLLAPGGWNSTNISSV